MVLEDLQRYVGERAGRKLPGEREMAALFGISRPRLRGMLAELERAGWVERRQGSGTYATPPVEGARPLVSSVLLLIDAGLRLNDDPFFSSLVEQLQSALQSLGTRCVVRRLSPATRLPQEREQGIITLGLDAGARLLAESPAPGTTPAVVLFAPAPRLQSDAPISAVECDNVTAGETAAHCLLAQGVETIRFFGNDAIPASRERLTGVQQALPSAAAPLRPLLLVSEAGLNFAAGQQAARTMPLPDARTGIVAANDWLALGIRTGLAARGVAPSACPLVSFDGLDVAADPSLAIRSLAVPLDAIAADAVAELSRLARRPAPPGRVLRYAFSWRYLATPAV